MGNVVLMLMLMLIVFYLYFYYYFFPPGDFRQNIQHIDNGSDSLWRGGDQTEIRERRKKDKKNTQYNISITFKGQFLRKYLEVIRDINTSFLQAI